jgi:DNA polymerase-3 subunit epsilon
MDFAFVDVETANADLSSICQVGIAPFRAGLLVGANRTLMELGSRAFRLADTRE